MLYNKILWGFLYLFVERRSSMNQYYEEIMALRDADDFKSVVGRWQTLSENMKSLPTNAPVLLPDMLWVARSGVGKTELLRLMSEYLAAQGNLMDFYGDVKFFEFLLSYCSPREPFSELRRLMDEVYNAAGFRSEFRGIIHIDINEWLDHYEEPHFISLMEYLSSNSDNWLIVLTVYTENEEKLHNLISFLSMYLRIETMTLALPKTEDLFYYIENQLSQYGLTLADDAKKLLHDSIETIRKNKYFDGFKSIKMLCQDIVYSVYSEKGSAGACLTAEQISHFAADGEYVRRTVANIEKVSRIGLLNRGE